jgi:2-polyprenyl-6-hydroxyphenyl methylase/3-demethylubiquinone-9 3-methyltransferase
MISTHEIEVASRFDLLHTRFKRAIADDDYRLRGITNALGSVRGLHILDLGCGKGRFARVLQARGARVVGIDLSSAMLAEAIGLNRVRATARRLPFPDQSFDAIIAVEVFEHLHHRLRGSVLREAQRVLRPEGIFAIVDKNVGSMNAQRPWIPNIAIKRLDELRGRWMYPHGGPVRERWFWPSRLHRELAQWFSDVRTVHLCSPAESAYRLFRFLPPTRLMILWVARVPGGAYV